MTEDHKPELLPLPKTMPEMKARLRALWNGDVPLFDTFWVYYFAIVFILSALSSIDGVIGVLFNIVMLGWAGFMVRPIWMAADRYKGERIWATAAKILAVLLAVFVVGQLVNL
jgi:hypothetical protein